MLGLRGCRLGLMIPDFVKVQTRAILNALIAVKATGGHPKAKIMIPLVGHVNELRRRRTSSRPRRRPSRAAAGVEVEYVFGTMIEVPRGALTADEIAQHAEFFSFGTNDLTQMTFGYSRDDAEGGFLLKYVEDGILPVQPVPDPRRRGRRADEDGRRQGPRDPPRHRARDLRRARRRPGVDRQVRADRARLRVVLAVPRPGRPARRGAGRPGRRRTRQVAARSSAGRPRRPLAALMTGAAGRVRRLFLDTAPLRLDRDYRWLWSGQVVNGIGNQITRIALPYQVYVLTGSTLAIAALTLFQLVPILLFALGAGLARRRRRPAPAADGRPRPAWRRAASRWSSWRCSGSPPIAALFAVAFVAAGLARSTSRRARRPIPRLVPAGAAAGGDRAQPAQLPDGLDRRAGDRRDPHRDGRAGRRLRRRRRLVPRVARRARSRSRRSRRSAPSPGPGSPRSARASRFARQRRAILGSFVIDLNAMIFGMPTSLFPVLALDVFQTGPAGLRAAGGGAGGRARSSGALFSGWVVLGPADGSGDRRSPSSCWGLAITAFGLVTVSFPLALVFLALAGAADVFSAVFRSTLVQLETPDELRGRVTSIHILVVTSGPRLGDIEAAVVAALVGAPVRGRVGRHRLRASASGSSPGGSRSSPATRSGQPCASAAPRSVPYMGVAACRSPPAASGGRRRRRVRRAVRRAQPRHRPRGPPDARRPAQLPPVPAAALPGRDRRAVARRHRPAAPLGAAQAAQHDGDPRRGGRHRPRAPRGPAGRRRPDRRTTRSSSRPAPITPTSTTRSGRRSRPGSRRSRTRPRSGAGS